jgi:hypothetical protein
VSGEVQIIVTLYKYTPLGQAILKLFTHLRQALITQYPSLAAGQVKAYLFGGAAMHLYTNARSSSDVDAQLDARIRLDTDIVITYADEPGKLYYLALDTHFNDTLGLFHPDYRQAAIPLQLQQDSPLWLYVASPLDLAVSKTGRWADIDRTDVQTLAEHQLITEPEFTQRAEEALQYWVGNEVMLRYNIRDARQIILAAA